MEEKKFIPENWDKEVEAVELVLYEHQEMTVSNQEQYDTASDFIKQANTTIKIVENKRKRYTEPLDEMKKAIMAKRNAIVKPLEDKIEQIKGMMVAWFKQEQLRIAEEQKKIEAEALSKAKVEGKTEVTVPVLEVAKTQRTGFSTATMKKVWLFEVVDKAKVPQEFTVIDEVAVRAAIRDGVREVEGLRIYEDVAPNIR